jgi:hypothetical protein
MKKFLKNLQKNFRQIDTINRQKAIDDLQWEVQELKHIFALMTMATFIGMPSAPLPMTIDLMNDMQEEFIILLSKIDMAHNPLSDQFSRLDAI